MEILFLTTVLPAGGSTGGEIASQAVIRGLRAAGHSVVPVGYNREDEPVASDPLAVEVGRRPIESDSTSPAQIARWAASAVLRRVPYSVAKVRSLAYQRTARSLATSGRFGLAVIDHVQSAWLAPVLQRSGIPFVLLAHNVEAQLYGARASATAGFRRRVYTREARIIERLERAVAQRAVAVWALTEEDAHHFADAARVHVLPVASDFDPPRGEHAKQTDIALIGTWTWSVTRSALVWFLERVVPLLPQHLEIAIAGRGAEWIDETYRGARAVGFVPDAMAFLASARVVAVPAVGGTGVQIKTLDAIASGVRVVASRAAVRGLGAVPDSVRVVETHEEFARALTELGSPNAPSGPAQSAIEWSRQRRARFQAEIESAIRSAS
jgi:glycosyltransferase involved in cell wall biosynthesis